MSKYIYKLIEEGEHGQQDFKFCINDSKKIAKSLVAFANTSGGRLLVGVKDNGRVAGVQTDEEYYMVESAALIYSKPQVKFAVKQWRIEGKTVLEISVENSSQKPHFAKDENGQWLAYIRVKDENILAHKVQVRVWEKESAKTGIHFSYSEDEKFLIDYLLNHPSITFSKFIRTAHISRKKAEEILSNFIVMNLIEIKTTGDGTTFILNKEEPEIKKFR